MKAQKRLLSLLLTFSMLLGLVPAGSVALTAWAEGEEPALSADGYYEIYTADQLYWFAEQVNGGNTDINARLMDNIVINENVLTSDGELNGDGSGFRAWTPIGNSNSKIYKGTFDGNNKTISGIYINNGSASYQGLFGNNSGTIQNVGVIDSYIKGSYNVGGVCGRSYGTISNCYNAGTVSGKSVQVSGICGLSSGTINNCYNTGVVSGESNFVGGVCGANVASSTISNSYNTGAVSGNMYVGGICGENNNSSTISNCCYLDTSALTGIGDGSGEAVSKTAEQFASGEVCWLLNNQGENREQLETPVWYQNVDMGDADALPLLNNEHYAVYRAEDFTYDCEAAKPLGVYTNITSGGHSFGTEWTADADNHWHECACGAISDEAAHSFEWITDKEAEVGAAGSKHEECTVCGYAKEAVEIPALETPEDSSSVTDSADDESSAVDSESSQSDDSEESTAASDSEAESTNDSSSTSGDKSPNTGDNRSVLLLMFVLVSGTALAGTAVYSKKKGKQDR
ncbi:GLUG motif-containing protein [Ruminococcus sp. Marseille-P6503]|uniref:GLUG motif-containing protein n=1 Tax=Ruminococcus sp. Marseille-P6503 TaxID=2364796 RepID=UPI000F524736|nr:GLUG motif-containing protein [Ruminococcus sp. Marseille-P6503]